LRFLDPHNDREPFSATAYDDWMPVDVYVGGAEHAVLHLLYARFWHKVLFDLGLVKHPEPFLKLVHQGMILGEVEYTTYNDAAGQPIDQGLVKEEVDTGPRHVRTGEMLTLVKLGEAEVQKSGTTFVLKADPKVRVSAMAHKMSKARGNVVNPDDIVRDYGADALRLYEMFMGPLDAVKPWQTAQIQGVVRFCDKVVALGDKPITPDADISIRRALHKTIKKVTSDIEAMSFNTAVSALMVFANQLSELPAVPREALLGLLQLVAPFAPHLAEELWHVLGHDQSIAHAPWPTHDEALCVDEVVEIAVQVNGRVRGRVVLPRVASDEDARRAALSDDGVKALVQGKEIKKLVYVPGKIINVVV
jgi:leucyl-tRNA synthetase